MKSIYDMIRESGEECDSLDVYDEDYDTGGTAWVLDFEPDEMDGYYTVVDYLSKHIEALGRTDEYSLLACIHTFVEDNIGIWSEFGKEFNHARAQIFDDSDDYGEGIYNGVTTIEQLVTGNYCDEAYEWLVERFHMREASE